MKKLSYILTIVAIIINSSGCMITDKDSGIKNTTTEYSQSQPELLKILICNVRSLGQFKGEKASPSSAMLEQIVERAKIELNIELKFDYIDFQTNGYDKPIAYDEKFNKCDIMFFSNSFNLLPDKDNLMDLTEHIQMYSEVVNYYFDLSELEQVTYNNKILGLPNKYRGSERLCAVVRTDLLEEMNITEIKDFEDYEEFMHKAKMLNKDLYNYSTIPPTYAFIQPSGYVRCFGNFVSQWGESETKLVQWQKTQAFVQAYDTMKRWVDKKYIPIITDPAEAGVVDSYQDYYRSSKQSLLSVLKQERLASFLSDWETAITFTEEVWDKYKFKVFPMYTEKTATGTAANHPVIVFNKHCKNIDKALLLIEWMVNSSECSKLFSYGLNGLDYVTVNNEVKLLGSVDKNSRWSGRTYFINDRNYVPNINNSNINATSYNPIYDNLLKYSLAAQVTIDFSKELIVGIDESEKNFIYSVYSCLRVSSSVDDAIRYITEQCSNDVNILPLLQGKN